MKYKAVIFDFDDTLTVAREMKWAHHKHVAKKFYNIHLTDEDIRKHWGKPLDKLVRTLYQDADTLENMYHALISVRDDFLKKPCEGASAAVHALVDRGIPVGILSATNRKYLVEDIIRLGFPEKDLVVIQGADETDFHKPDPRVFLPLLKTLHEKGIEESDTVYVGDSMDDFKAATGAGMHFIGITTGLYSAEDFKKAGVKTIIKDIREIVELVC